MTSLFATLDRYAAELTTAQTHVQEGLAVADVPPANVVELRDYVRNLQTELDDCATLGEVDATLELLGGPVVVVEELRRRQVAKRGGRG